jgi:Na+:H+ antiporter, NhaA family
VLSNVLTFAFFVLIGLEIRQGLNKPREIVFPAVCAALGMLLPAIIFVTLNSGSNAWAIAMPTDVALAIGALSILGKRINPSVRLFLLTLAVADDFFSLIVIAIFFGKDLHLSSAIYTFGAALIGALLPKRDQLIKYLSPLITFIVIPIYIWINLLDHINFGESGSKVSLVLITSRVLGKSIGILSAAWLLNKYSSFKLPISLNLKEIFGVGLLAGMGMTVALVISKITLFSDKEIDEARIGLLLSAIISGLLGIVWLRFSD